MLSGAVSWNVLEEQLANSRSSGDKIRRKIFDFMQEFKGKKQSKERLKPVSQEEVPVSNMWMSTAGDSCTSVMQESTLSNPQRLASDTRNCYRSWVVNTKKCRESNPWHWETVSMLKAVLDMSTHLCNYPVPLDTRLARFVVAKGDLYIPRHDIASVQTTWPGMCACAGTSLKDPPR